MDFEDFKTKYPDIHGKSFDEGKAEGIKAGLEQGKREGRTEGAVAALSQAKNLQSHTENKEKKMTVEERIIFKWKTDPNIRTEFGNDFQAWAAYYEAYQKGRVKILKGKVIH